MNMSKTAGCANHRARSKVNKLSPRSTALSLAILLAGLIEPASGNPTPELFEAPMLRAVLQDLEKTHAIRFSGMEKIVDEPVGRFHGTVRERVQALLRNYNTVIIQSSDATIEKVIIVGRIDTLIKSASKLEVRILSERPRPVSPEKCIEPAGGSLLDPLSRLSNDSIRVSSEFGMRKHPIRGHLASHKGIDLAASEGTPVYAVGDGLVVTKDWKHGYGNIVRLRHDRGVETVYAHLSRFASTLRKDDRVRRGEMIGHVGSTGKSTASHLHYEVLFEGRHVDPRHADRHFCSRSLEAMAQQPVLY